MPNNEDISCKSDDEPKVLGDELATKCVCDQPSACTHAVHLCRALSMQSRSMIQEYFCTGSINEDQLQYKHIPEFLSISQSIKGLSHLKRVCATKLMHNLHKDNMFETFEMSDTYELQDVSKKCADEIVKHIDEVKDTSQFLALRNSQMKELVRSRSSQERLLIRDAVDRWWQCDSMRRGDVYTYLRDKIAGKVFHSDSWSGRDGTIYLLMFSMTKSGDETCPVAYVYDISCGTGYSVKLRDTWDLNTIYLSCCIQPSATDPPYIFVSGRGPKSVKLLQCDVIMNKWKICASMKYPRTHHAMEKVGEKIYILGGKMEGKNVSHIEEFDHKKNAWSVVGDLKWNVSSPLTIAYKKKIFLFGGKNNEGEDVSAIQVFDVEEKTVKVLGYLPVECSGGRAITVGHSVYIVTEQTHCIKYCTEKNKCTILKEQPEKRQMFGLYLKDKHIFVTGGLNEQNQSVDYDLVYSTSEKLWTKVDHKGEKWQGVSGQCIVKVPSHIQFHPLC